MEEVLKVYLSIFMIITLRMRLVHLIRHLVIQMGLDAQLRLNAKTVSLKKDVGLKKKLKSMESANSEMLLVKLT